MVTGRHEPAVPPSSTMREPLCALMFFASGTIVVFAEKYGVSKRPGGVCSTVGCGGASACFCCAITGAAASNIAGSARRARHPRVTPVDDPSMWRVSIDARISPGVGRSRPLLKKCGRLDIEGEPAGPSSPTTRIVAASHPAGPESTSLRRLCIVNRPLSN